MSTGEYIKVCFEDLVKVESLIEQCLLHYMTQKQVIDILYQLQHIEPAFTETVWQKLEEQNQEFFQSYYLRVVVNEQIMEFNNLLGRQVALMNQVDPSVASFPPVSNVSHMPAMKTENMQPSVPTVLVNGFNNCGPFIHSGMQHALDRSTYSRRIDVPSNMVLAHNSDIRMMEGIVIKSEPGYLDNSRYMISSNIGEVASILLTAAIGISEGRRHDSCSASMDESCYRWTSCNNLGLIQQTNTS
ncbi:hypothetical protein Ccrd_013305 [Cynara cardunculus var. scolymus]|uniref:Uncharacterized protein n=1 Tax=Cynara cardunculus var. scolymus TaxID=59895 RepID=A0A118K500_CYNCS|nr:hypothetical protein Ccrd_013305 [Cynara cardunculus var. scolymus]